LDPSRMFNKDAMARVVLPIVLVCSLLTQLALSPAPQNQGSSNSSEFHLFEDFDLSRTALHLSLDDPDLYLRLNWMRREMTRPSLSFYLDKVRYKTYLQSQGVPIPTVYFMGQFKDPEPEQWMNHFHPKSYHEQVISQHAARILPEIEGRRNYVAKVSHLSYGDGVVVIKDFDHNFLAEFGMTEELADPTMPATTVAHTLAKTLHNPATYQTSESWVLQQVPPGLVVEERLAKPAVGDDDDGDDDGPAMEFKTFTIWGRAHLTVWCQAGVVHGIVFRNGTARETTTGLHSNGTGFMHASHVEKPLPAWVDWPRVVEVSEQLGANKDMFRTDVFVGVSADSNRTLEEVKYVVSEVEVHSTYGLGNMQEEVGRLWLQGYLDNAFVTIPNGEVQPPHPESLFSSLKNFASTTLSSIKLPQFSALSSTHA